MDRSGGKRNSRKGPCGLWQVFMAENSHLENGNLRVKQTHSGYPGLCTSAKVRWKPGQTPHGWKTRASKSHVEISSHVLRKWECGSYQGEGTFSFSRLRTKGPGLPTRCVLTCRPAPAHQAPQAAKSPHNHLPAFLGRWDFGWHLRGLTGTLPSWPCVAARPGRINRHSGEGGHRLRASGQCRFGIQRRRQSKLQSLGWSLGGGRFPSVALWLWPGASLLGSA